MGQGRRRPCVANKDDQPDCDKVRWPSLKDGMPEVDIKPQHVSTCCEEEVIVQL